MIIISGRADFRRFFIPLLLFGYLSYIVDGRIHHPRCLTAPFGKVRYYLFPHEVNRKAAADPSRLAPHVTFKLENGIKHAYYDFLSFEDDDDDDRERSVTEASAIRVAGWPRGTQEYRVSVGKDSQSACFTNVSYATQSMVSTGQIRTFTSWMSSEKEREKISSEFESMCAQKALAEMIVPEGNPPIDGEWFGNSRDLRISLKYTAATPTLEAYEIDAGSFTREQVVADPGKEYDASAARYRILYVKIGDVFLVEIADLRKSRNDYTELPAIRYTVLEPVYSTPGLLTKFRRGVFGDANGGPPARAYDRVKDSSTSTDMFYGVSELRAWKSV